MGLLANVVRRAGTFHFRRVIPTAAREALGRRELVRTLNTSDPRIARPRAAQLYLLSERIFETAGRGAMLDEAKLARLVQDFYATILDQENRARLGSRALHPEARDKRHAYFSDVAAKNRDALACNRLGDAAIVTECMLRKQNIAPATLDASELAQARQAILRAGVDVAEALKARYEGDFNHEPRDKLLRLKLDEIDSRAPRPDVSQSATPSAGEPAPVPTPTQTSPLMSEAGAAFREAQVATSGWDKQTAHQAGATFRLFIEICGDHALGAYTRKDAGRFKEAVERLPADYGKAPRYRGRSAAEIAEIYAALSEGERADPITQKTVRRHFSALSTLWASALAKDEVPENIFSGFRFANAKRANQQRAMWEQEELRRLFTSPVWAGCASKGRRSAPGDLVIKDERFWLPLVAVLSGLRLEEICQLHVDDIRTSESVIYFDINARPPRKLKNETAVRQVPVHSALKQLGFTDQGGTRHRVEASLNKVPRLPSWLKLDPVKAYKGERRCSAARQDTCQLRKLTGQRAPFAGADAHLLCTGGTEEKVASACEMRGFEFRNCGGLQSGARTCRRVRAACLSETDTVATGRCRPEPGVAPSFDAPPKRTFMEKAIDFGDGQLRRPWPVQTVRF